MLFSLLLSFAIALVIVGPLYVGCLILANKAAQRERKDG